MRRGGGVSRALAGLGAVMLAVVSVPLVFAPPAAAATSPSISMTVQQITPGTPVISKTPRRVTFELRLTNTSTSTLSGITVQATRSDPIGDQSALNAAIASPKAPSDDLRSDVKDKDGKVVQKAVAPIASGASTTVDFSTTMSTTNDATTGICACGTLIYPIYFTATSTSSDGTSTDLGHTQTYLPSFTKQPAKTKVAWVWPLLDRPHRLRQDTLFTDDDLATEVAPGGRLDNLLTVLENVSGSVPMEVVTDPDLIDSLAVMSTGYTIATRNGYVRGQASEEQAAANWLSRLKVVLADHPDVQLAFTAYADPAVEALTRAGLSWTATASAQAQQRIDQALGATVISSISWPVGEQVSQPTLNALDEAGANPVILRDTALTSGTREVAGTTQDKTATEVPADALAALRTAGGSVKVAVTSSPIEALVRRILTSSTAEQGLPLVPTLVAQLAIRAQASFYQSRVVVITPPRQLTVADPQLAERAILDTARTVWSTPILLSVAAQTLATVDHGRLRAYTGGRTIAGRTLRILDRMRSDEIPAATDLFADTSVAATELGTMDVAMQRVESTGLLTQPINAHRYAVWLQKFVRGITGSVTLAKLYKGSGPNAVYTLASKDATLPVTVVNNLDAAVRIRVTARAKDDEPGFSADTTRVHTLAPGQRVQLRLVTHVKRVGQIPIVISLETEGEHSTGVSQTVTIRSTALGTIGVVITIVAGVVLVLAIVVRGVKRQLYRRRQKLAAAS